MDELYKTTVTLNIGEDIDQFIQEMQTENLAHEYVPERAVDVSDLINESLVNTEFLLTADEAEQLRHDPRVRDIRVGTLEEHGVEIRHFTFAEPITSTNDGSWATGNIDVNWGLSAITGNTGILNSNSIANYSRPYTLDGTGVDIIIMDSGLQINHPEFQNQGGVSRVQTIDWFGGIGNATGNGTGFIGASISAVTGITLGHPSKTPNMPVGATVNAYNFYVFGVANTAILNGSWTVISGGNNNATRFSFGRTIDLTGITSTDLGIVTYFPTSNTVSGYPNFYTDNDGHATHVAGIAAGKTYGWAKNANIYAFNINGTTANGEYDFSASANAQTGINLIKYWHYEKPVTSTGYRRPTIVNGSWGLTFGASIVANYNYRAGATVNTTWNSSNASTLTNVGLVSNTNYNANNDYLLYRSTAIEAELESAIANGVIFVGAAGNDSFVIDTGVTTRATLTNGNSVITNVASFSGAYVGGIFAQTIGNTIQTFTVSNITAIDLVNRTLTISGWTPNVSTDSNVIIGGKDWLNLVGYTPTVGVSGITPYNRGSGPFAIASSIVVGAIQGGNIGSQAAKAAYSATGNRIDVFAPGSNITSAMSNTYNSAYASGVRPYPANTGYNCAKLSGTSQSTPQVTGLVACLLESRPFYTSQDVKWWLSSVSDTTKLGGGNLAAYNNFYSLQTTANRYLFNPFNNNNVTNANIRGGSGTIFGRF